MTSYTHIPVLLQEVLQLTNPKPGDVCIDATLGGGGYTKALLDRIVPNGKVLAIDLDIDAIKNFQFPISNSPDRVTLAHGNFADVATIAKEYGFMSPQVIVADIGLSSYELDQAGRGISFQKNEPLDMRFNASGKGKTAASILANATEEELAYIFNAYGEEKFATKIARDIVRNRTSGHIATTFELVNFITASIPGRLKHKALDSVRRIFQSLRIAVNGELENLERFLPDALHILAPGGVLAVVSFHSLEDRIVKQFFAKTAQGCICPKDFPICRCAQSAVAEILTKKPIVAGDSEVSRNSRAKSAKLRAIRKL